MSQLVCEINDEDKNDEDKTDISNLMCLYTCLKNFFFSDFKIK